MTFKQDLTNRKEPTLRRGIRQGEQPLQANEFPVLQRLKEGTHAWNTAGQVLRLEGDEVGEVGSDQITEAKF